jgi:hypothetical protein
MTADAILEALDSMIERSFTNDKTIRSYKAALRRIALRVPVEAWGNVSVMRLYRESLSDAARGLFGVVWSRVVDKLESMDIPVVSMEDLTRATFTVPLLADIANRLSILHSIEEVPRLTWGHVSMKWGAVYVDNKPLPHEDEAPLALAINCAWNGLTPPKNAPLVPIHPTLPRIAMPADLVATTINTFVAPQSTLGRVIARTYTEAIDAGMPLSHIEGILNDFEMVFDVARRRDRERALDIAQSAIHDLAFDLDEFGLKWDAIKARVLTGHLDTAQEARWFKGHNVADRRREPATNPAPRPPIHEGVPLLEEDPLDISYVPTMTTDADAFKRSLKDSNRWLSGILRRGEPQVEEPLDAE